MKKWLLAVAMALVAGAFVAPAAMAQGGGGGRGPGGGPRMMEMMMRGITLAPEQKVKVDSITAKYQAQMPAFTPGTPPSPEDRQKRMELMQKQSSEIRAVLTDEQKAVWDKNQEEMRARRPGA